MQQNLGSVLVELLPLMIGAAIAPILIIIVLLLLGSQGGLLKGAAFIGGAIVLRLTQGIVFGYIFTSNPAATSETGGNLIVSTLLVVIAVLMLITAFKKWDKEEDPDAPPPRWLTALGGLSVPKAFGMGAALIALSAKQWVFTLSAIGVIETARLAPSASLGLFLFYVLATQPFGLIAVIAVAVAPRAAGAAVDQARQWLERHNRPVLIAFSLIFGLFFLFTGITGLLG
jgi:hypothetical protein